MDICSNVDDCVNQVKKIAMNAQVYPISVKKGLNLDVFNQYILPGKTIVFLGSSGIGKSTLTNALLGEEKQKIQSISAGTGKGRHTTTSVNLIFHSSGCMIVDTPGLKEIQLWGDEDVLDQSFADIKEITLNCRFKNCQHDKEPGCAIKRAIQNGAEIYLKII